MSCPRASCACDISVSWPTVAGVSVWTGFARPSMPARSRRPPRQAMQIARTATAGLVPSAARGACARSDASPPEPGPQVPQADKTTKPRWARPATGQAATRSAVALASQAEIDTKPMIASPLSDQDRPVTARPSPAGALRSAAHRRFGFDNSPLRQYNPLYLRRAASGPNSFGRAA